MIFSQIGSPRSGILQNIERKTSLGLGTITDNTSPEYYKDEFLGYVNKWNNIVNIWIHEVDNEWSFDDANHGDFPIETFDIVDSQQDYGIDIDISAIKKVEIHDADDVATDGWITIPIKLSTDIEADRFGNDDGTPSSYWLSGNSILFDVPVDIAKIDKYRITYDRHAHAFVIGDTTAVPGFAEPFHDILVYGATMDWAEDKKKTLFNACKLALFGTQPRDKNGLKQMLQKYYSKRAEEFTPQIRRKEPSGGSWE